MACWLLETHFLFNLVDQHNSPCCWSKCYTATCWTGAHIALQSDIESTVFLEVVSLTASTHAHFKTTSNNHPKINNSGLMQTNMTTSLDRLSSVLLFIWF